MTRLAGGGRTKPLELWGPVGIENVGRGIELMFTDFRLSGGEITKDAMNIVTHQISEGVIYDQDGVKVTAFLVNHGHVVPAFGYRVDYGGRTVVLSGDTAYSANLVEQAKGGRFSGSMCCNWKRSLGTVTLGLCSSIL